MDRLSHTRRLLHALLLLGTVNAGCATASLADGEKTQAPLPNTPAASQSVVDASTTTQSQTDQVAPRQPSESAINAPATAQPLTQSSESEVNVSAPTTPQTDQSAPRQSSEAVVNAPPPTQSQTDQTAPKQSEAEDVAPGYPQNDIPAAVQPQTSETPPDQSPDNAPAQPQTDNPPTAQQEPDQEIDHTALARTEVNPSVMLTGRVWRAKPGIVFLKTPIGLMSLSSKTTLKTLPASQEVSFWIHEDHVVVDIVKRTDGSLVHRYLTGPFRRDQEDGTQLMGWTPEGEKAFHMGAYERALASRKDGQSVTVEVDGTDTVIGVHDMQFDLQIGQVAANGSKAHVLLTGTISKLKSNFIFFRTPIGIVNVNPKIGITHAKVGQTLTLRMHDHHVVADLSASIDSAPIRRFITGPLEYADPDRAGVRFWTPEGEQIYPADFGKSALNGAREGTPITVELDGLGDVVEFHRMK